jgi:hypothetical protein
LVEIIIVLIAIYGEKRIARILWKQNWYHLVSPINFVIRDLYVKNIKTIQPKPEIIKRKIGLSFFVFKIVKKSFYVHYFDKWEIIRAINYRLFLDMTKSIPFLILALKFSILLRVISFINLAYMLIWFQNE